MPMSKVATSKSLVRASLALLMLVPTITGCAAGPEKKVAKPAQNVYAFWPQAPEAPHVQFVRSFEGSDDVVQAKESTLDKLVFGPQSKGKALINKPYGVAMKNGKIYTCDIRNNCVAVLDLAKKQTRLMGISGLHALKRPVSVAVSDDGMIYVADNDIGGIFVFDASEKYVSSFSTTKMKPAAVAVCGDRVYASDMTTQVVQVFDRKTGKSTGTIGSVGDSDGQFRLPLGIATDRDGNVYVADMMRCCIQKFSAEGSFVWSMGQLGDYAGSFARPKHITVDSEGILYVVDAAFQNVQMFDKDKRLLMHFGSAGGHPGAMNLPAGICVSDDSMPFVESELHPGFKGKRVLVVSNQFGTEKVSMYALGELKPGYTAEQLAAVSAPVPTGVGEPSKERLRLQSPGEEPPATDPGAGPSNSPTPKQN